MVDRSFAVLVDVRAHENDQISPESDESAVTP